MTWFLCEDIHFHHGSNFPFNPRQVYYESRIVPSNLSSGIRYLDIYWADWLGCCFRTFISIIVATLVSTQHDLTTKPPSWHRLLTNGISYLDKRLNRMTWLLFEKVRFYCTDNFYLQPKTATITKSRVRTENACQSSSMRQSNYSTRSVVCSWR